MRVLLKNHNVGFSAVDFTGVLTVTDVDLFKVALFNGIGRSKAFGCGMLLIRRI
ncbi:MAG: type I-E CRISPR-associated protein Cas6/Cse3/CasE [Gammaproteobacteria bacterium]|nr:type I-E CRISPR-associated protein Cas6/Cse3/CasE [Gammaproteobacteria bacterium]